MRLHPAFALRTLRRSIAVVAGMTIFAGGAASAAPGSLPSIDVKGMLDVRGIISSDAKSAEDQGLGKTRFGAGADENRRILGRVAEASLLIEPRIMWDLSGVILLSATPEQRTVIDVVEAYLQYKPAQTGPWGVQMRAGAFFPPISLENTGLAWTSPYTITPSAINSWVGEELRTIGGEAKVIHKSDALALAATVAAFGYNDPGGTLLAWRGWSFDDRKTGLMDRLKLPLVRIIRPGAILDEQGTDRPFHEIDNKVGFYGSVSADYAGYGTISVLRYDNRGNNRIYSDDQWSWYMSFWSLGLRTQIAGNVDLLAQGMTGTTTLITTRVGPIVDVNFRSAYGLISKGWDNQRVSFRVDWFDTKDRDIFPDNNNEHGYALTAAYILRPMPKQRLTLELLYIDSTRPERLYQGYPIRAHETQFQVSYRFFL